MNTSLKILFTTSIVLIAYGYLSRFAGVFFFWESLPIGWMVFLVSLTSFLSRRSKRKKLNGRKRTIEIIGIIVLVGILFTQVVILLVLPKTDAYAAAKKYIDTNENILSETGHLKSCYINPVGGMAIASSDAGTAGNANMLITVKGEKGFKDVWLHLEKDIESEWTVVNAE